MGGNLKSPVGIIVSAALFLTLLGNVFIWVKARGNGHQEVSDRVGVYAVVLIVIAASNMGCFLFELKTLCVAGAGLMVSVLTENVCSAHAFDVNNANGLLLTGYILALIGALASFAVFPREGSPDFSNKHNLVTVALGVLLLVGSICVWASDGDRDGGVCGGAKVVLATTPAFLAVWYMVSVLFSFDLGKDFSFFLATVLLDAVQPFGPRCHGACEAGNIIIFIALIILIGWHTYLKYEGGMDLNKLKDGKGLVLLGCFVITLLGAIFIWTTKVSSFPTTHVGAQEAFDAAMLVLTTLALVGCYCGNLPILTIAAFGFMFSIINAVTGHAYYHNEGLIRLGYILALVGALTSFIGAPLQWGRPDINDGNRVAAILGVVLLVACMLVWSEHLFTVQGGWVAAVYMASSFFEFPPGVDFAFFGALLLVTPYSPFATGAGGAAKVGIFVCFLAFFVLILLYLFGEEGGESQPLLG